jgi:hypothetical protein
MRKRILLFRTAQAWYFCAPILNGLLRLIPLDEFQFARTQIGEGKGIRAVLKQAKRADPAGQISSAR